MRLRDPSKCGRDDLVFAIPKDGDWVLLLKPQALKVFKAQITEMGLNEDHYSFHSFRFGGIQEALLADAAVDLIRQHSDHKSDAICGYLNLPGTRRFDITQKVSARLSQLRVTH